MKLNKKFEDALEYANEKSENAPQIKRPRYLTLGEGRNKSVVLTPKQIIPIKIQGHDFMVFGDPRCSKCSMPLHMLEECKENNQILIILKTKKKKGAPTGMMAFTRIIEELLHSRKWRLVNAESLHMISEASGVECESPTDFMRSELEIEEDVDISYEDLEVKFLSSLSDDLICKDIVRVLQLYYQDEKENANAIHNKPGKKNN